MTSQNDIYFEMLKRKIPQGFLSDRRIKNISNRVNNSIFTDECAIYETIDNNDNKNMFYRRYTRKTNGEWRSVNLLKALYQTFYRKLEPDEYIRAQCRQRLCICMNHLLIKKFKRKEPKKEKEVVIKEAPSLTVHFD